MKTVGQILHTARDKRGLSVDQLSMLTKIDSKYIDALEKDQYHDLPSETFAKGFIRNLCQRLDLDANELVAIFRRDYRLPVQSKPKKRHQRFFSGSLTQILPFLFGALVFFVYLIFQFRAIVIPPKLKIISPTDNAVIVSPLEIDGETDSDTTIYINEETKVKPDSSGRFFTKLSLPVGETEITIKAINRFSRSSSKTITVTIISK